MNSQNILNHDSLARILSYLVIVFLTPAIILINFRFLVFNQNFYEKEFNKLNVYSQIEPETAQVESQKLIKYLCCKGELNENFFSELEIAHLKDVKSLIGLANILLYFYGALIIAIILILFANKKRLLVANSLKTASIVGIIALLLLFIASRINFDLLFLNFHLISFRNDNWLLPENANLIKLFPQIFFRDFANRIALQSLVMLSAIFLITNFVKRK